MDVDLKLSSLSEVNYIDKKDSIKFCLLFNLF